MSWPRFRLTPEEAKYCQKYEDPSKAKQRVLRRMYAGELNITSTIRQDTETFQISRRSRVMALTASGDVHSIEIQIIDSSGEQYTTDFIPISTLLCGSSWDLRSVLFYNGSYTNGRHSPGLNTGFTGTMGYYTPYVFEPCIVLAPNQTLSFNARMVDPSITGPVHVDLTLHVWEFPGMPGSPV